MNCKYCGKPDATYKTTREIYVQAFGKTSHRYSPDSYCAYSCFSKLEKQKIIRNNINTVKSYETFLDYISESDKLKMSEYEFNIARSHYESCGLCTELNKKCNTCENKYKYIANGM